MCCMTQLADAGLLTPACIAEAAEEAMVGKAGNQPWRMFLLALMGGGWIALGFVFYVTSQVGASGLPWGLTRLIGGTVFSVGLLLVVVTGAELFTSTTMTLIAKAAGRLTWGKLLRHWAIVYMGNFLGALAIMALCWFGGLPHHAKGAWGRVVLDSASAKLSHSWGEAFTLGVFCNLCVCAAVWMSYAGRSVVDKAIAVVGPVALFVATGMEHSVANMFLIPLGISVRTIDAGGGYDGLTWVGFLWRNLLPVTLGNIVGGGVMVGLMGWFVQRRRGARDRSGFPGWQTPRHPHQ